MNNLFFRMFSYLFPSPLQKIQSSFSKKEKPSCFILFSTHNAPVMLIKITKSFLLISNTFHLLQTVGGVEPSELPSVELLEELEQTLLHPLNLSMSWELGGGFLSPGLLLSLMVS